MNSHFPQISAVEAEAPPKHDDSLTDRHEEPNEFEFRLFSRPAEKSGEAVPQKIRLRSPSLDRRDPGFVIPHRPKSFYFADHGSETWQREIASAAVTGEHVVARSRQPWPGCAYPWKVVTIVASGQMVPQDAGVTITETRAPTGRRRRLGKKGRIAIRQRVALRRKTEEGAKMAALEKEAAEREKRTRRNREKKVKKKEREKAKKQAASAV